MSTPEPRAALLEAGRRLAIHEPEPAVPALEREAGLADGTLVSVFGSLEQYLVDLQQDFMNALRSEVIAATTEKPAGFVRIKSGAEAYLDGCLSRRGLRHWFIVERQRNGLVAGSLRRQNGTYRLILPGEFVAMQWPHPKAGARLFLALLMEAARSEHDLGRADPDLRAGIWHFLRTYEGRTG